VAREHFLAFIQRLGSQKGAPALILVTHHVEEIMPVFTHALLLRQGRVVAKGPKSEVLTSAGLSEVFGAKTLLQGDGNSRFALQIVSSSTHVVY
jgi:iron complex transport system ATP-binding protein